jgi:hypothetical protein
MQLNSESVSNEIDESDLQQRKQPEQRSWTQRGIIIEHIGVYENAWQAIRATPSRAARGGKKMEEVTTMACPDPNSNPTQTAVLDIDVPETRILTLAATQQGLYIVAMCPYDKPQNEGSSNGLLKNCGV